MLTKRAPIRKGRKRHDANGKLVRTSPHSAKLEHARLDRRTWASKIYVATCKDLFAYLGNEPSAPQSLLIDPCSPAQDSLDIAWGAAMRDGLNKQSPAFDNFLKALRNQRETLCLLGLERQARPVSLNDYIESRVAHEPA